MYEEVPNDPSVLVNTMTKALEKIYLKGDLSSATLIISLLRIKKLLGFIFYLSAYLVDQ